MDRNTAFYKCALRSKYSPLCQAISPVRRRGGLFRKPRYIGILHLPLPCAGRIEGRWPRSLFPSMARHQLFKLTREIKYDSHAHWQWEFV